MADFNFRWKNRGGNLPNLQPNFVDPMNTRITAANPGASMEQGAPQASQQEFLQRISQPGASIMEKEQKLADLERQLSEVDAEIAKIQTETADSRKAVAAKLAEIGDTSLYQGMLANERNAAERARSASAGIENRLYEAEGLTWGLKSKNAEDREMVRAKIEVAIRQAEEEARKQGVDLSANESYRRLKAALGEAGEAASIYEGDEKFANMIWSKSKSGSLTDADIAEAKKWIEEHPDSQFASKVAQVVDAYAPKTREAKARASKRKADAADLYYSLSSLPAEEVTKRIANLTSYEHKLLEDFYPEMLK